MLDSQVTQKTMLGADDTCHQLGGHCHLQHVAARELPQLLEGVVLGHGELADVGGEEACRNMLLARLLRGMVLER